MKYRIIEVVTPLDGLKYLVQLNDGEKSFLLLTGEEGQSESQHCNNGTYTLFDNQRQAENAVAEYVQNNPITSKHKKIVKEGEL